jgi:hypothetical protein
MASVASLNISTWNGVIPVLLPWGQPTIAPIGVASAGVAVPFVLYVIAMFVIIIPIWMRNFEDDKHAGGISVEMQQPQRAMVFMSSSSSISNNNNNGYMLQSESAEYPTDFRLRPQQQQLLGMY